MLGRVRSRCSSGVCVVRRLPHQISRFAQSWVVFLSLYLSLFFFSCSLCVFVWFLFLFMFLWAAQPGFFFLMTHWLFNNQYATRPFFSRMIQFLFLQLQIFLFLVLVNIVYSQGGRLSQTEFDNLLKFVRACDPPLDNRKTFQGNAEDVCESTAMRIVCKDESIQQL